MALEVRYTRDMSIENESWGEREIFPSTNVNDLIGELYSLNDQEHSPGERRDIVKRINHEFGEYGLTILEEGSEVDGIGLRILDREAFVKYLEMYQNSPRDFKDANEYYQILQMLNKYYARNRDERDDFIIAMGKSSGFLEEVLSDIKEIQKTEGENKMSILKLYVDLFTELSKIK